MKKEDCNHQNCNCGLLAYTKTEEFKKLSKFMKIWTRIKIALIETISYS